MNSAWLITSELANQRARKVLFTCVVYTDNWSIAQTARLNETSSLTLNESHCSVFQIMTVIYIYHGPEQE